MTIATYEMIKAIPGKGYDWVGFYKALLDTYETVCVKTGSTPLELSNFKQAKGVREMREAAYCMAGCIVERYSVKATAILASQDTLEDGGFLMNNVEVTRSVTTQHEVEKSLISIIQAFV